MRRDPNADGGFLDGPLGFVTLYDSHLGSLPEAQGWTKAQVPANGPATQVLVDGVAVLDSLASVDDKAGYVRLVGNELDLDRGQGFTLRIQGRLEAEAHDGSDRNGDGRDDRAGFSVVLLAKDRRGIELDFWLDEIWAQEGGPAEPPRFTHAEGAPFDTAAGFVLDITILGATYTVTGAGAPLLAGAVRDYTVEGAPYNVPGFVFVGDNTTSAKARVDLETIAVREGVPRPVYLPIAVQGGARRALDAAGILFAPGAPGGATTTTGQRPWHIRARGREKPPITGGGEAL